MLNTLDTSIVQLHEGAVVERLLSNLGFSIFAQGHFDMQLGEPGIQTIDLPITRRPPHPPEPPRGGVYLKKTVFV